MVVELSEEQQRALDRMMRSAVSVLTGAAGTGKSTLLAPLIAAIREREGRVPIRALAPTGKAADRLKAVGVDGMTVHRALASAGWYDWDLGIWREHGTSQISADTLVIDECSMVDISLLGTLFKAVDWHGVRRLILVGDHYQLPPIGPGRPFFDFIMHLEDADEDTDEANPYRARLNELSHNYRVAEGSRAIALANGFARQGEADEPLIWSSLAKGEDQGDLRVRFWADAQELHELLLAEIEELVTAECERAGLSLSEWQAFNATLGHKDAFGISHWQILGPVRDSSAGTRKLNAIIQDRWHGGFKQADRFPSGAVKRWPVSFGDEQITSFDKVMQIRNEGRLVAYDLVAKQRGKYPAFNGQLGIVRGEFPAANHSWRTGQKGKVVNIQVQFDGAPNLRFEYYRDGQRGVNRNLELAYAITIHRAKGASSGMYSSLFHRWQPPLWTRTRVHRAQPSGGNADSVSREGYRCADAAPQARRRADSAALLQAVHASARQRGVPQRRSASSEHSWRCVRSKSEVIIADVLHKYELQGRLSYTYEEELSASGGDPWDVRLPDFTVRVGGKTHYWEHCGMADDPAYRQRWEEVRRPWYVRNGYADQLIETYEEAGAINAEVIEREVVLGRILA